MVAGLPRDLAGAGGIRGGLGWLPGEKRDLGAAERWTDHIDVEDALLLPELAELRDQLNARLGPEAFDRAYEQGASSSADELLGFVSAPEPS